jgi:hypothetical protein
MPRKRILAEQIVPSIKSSQEKQTCRAECQSEATQINSLADRPEVNLQTQNLRRLETLGTSTVQYDKDVVTFVSFKKI